jgi:hypothetical protein
MDRRKAGVNGLAHLPDENSAAAQKGISSVDPAARATEPLRDLLLQLVRLAVTGQGELRRLHLRFNAGAFLVRQGRPRELGPKPLKTQFKGHDVIAEGANHGEALRPSYLRLRFCK